MTSFFRVLELEAEQAGEHAGAIRALRREEFEGLLIHGVYSPDACALVCSRLESGQHGLIRSDFPAPFRSYFLGVNLNLARPDLEAYFRAAPEFRAGLARLFAGIADLQTRTASLLSRLDDGRAYRAAPGPRPGLEHMFTTLRAHLPGGYISQHFDNEQSTRDSYRFILPNVAADIFSFVLAFSRAHAGGELEVFNLQHGGRSFRMVDGEESASRLSLEGVESERFQLSPGDMILFNSGRYLHRVTPVVGEATRWTACSFMAESRAGGVYCWG